MTMTKEEVEKRKADLIASRDQLLANLNSTIGAIQDCDYWLEKIEADRTELIKKVSPSQLTK